MAAESLRHLRCVQLRTSNPCLEELIYFRLVQVSYGNIQLPPALCLPPLFRFAVKIQPYPTLY